MTFEQEEIEAMKKSSTGTGLTLLGFKPKEKAIKPWYHMKPSQFIYPNEKAVKGVVLELNMDNPKTQQYYMYQKYHLIADKISAFSMVLWYLV